jgi:hypothetical protein
MAPPAANISTIRHPDYLYDLPDWNTWRWIWEGGDGFVRQYLQKWSGRESDEDFRRRREITPDAGFAKAALVDIKNAVFHRMGDIMRRGGSKAYQEAIAGHRGGVDRRGSSMNHFIGTQLLPEMLAMGKVGVFVDNIAPPGPTMADAANASPYLYMYKVEDILSWNCSLPEDESDYEAILLRDWCVDYDSSWGSINLPKGRFERYRLVWKEPTDGLVWYQFFDNSGQPIHADGSPGESKTRLNLTRIPFVLCDIGDSLLKSIATYQIALTNLLSSDLSYALKANFPFYVEQVDSRSMGSHLKSDVMEDGTASTGGQASADQDIKVGTIDGRTYDIKAAAPTFINPSSEPLKASMELQRKLEDDIRKLVNLAVISLGNSRASGEARNIDNQGLEAGLAFIGLVLETCERKIADHWSSYEGNDKRDSVVVKYPEQYSLKSQKERIEEADKLTDLMFSIPGMTVKKELAKDAVIALLAGRVPVAKLEQINKEIDDAKYSTSDPDVVKLAKEQMLASDITLSDALGFDGKTEIPKAQKDHEDRIERIQKAQADPTQPALGKAGDPAARGKPELSANPNAGKEEKAQATDTTKSDSTKKPTRGEGKKVNGDK